VKIEINLADEQAVLCGVPDSFSITTAPSTRESVEGQNVTLIPAVNYLLNAS